MIGLDQREIERDDSDVFGVIYGLASSQVSLILYVILTRTSQELMDLKESCPSRETFHMVG